MPAHQVDTEIRRPSIVPRLLIVNGLLLMLLGVVTFGASADAQSRARGSYTMVAGGVNGSSSGAVYIIDTTNQELMALTWDPNQQTLVGVGYRNLVQDMATISRGGPDR